MSRYTNGNGLLDSFATFWQTLATTFANRSAVLGYELLNEPALPQLIDIAELGLIDRVFLTPMYQRLHEVIRQVDDKHILFFEPCVADLLETGLTEGPGGAEYNNRQVFSYHIYCLDVTKQGDPKSDLVCEIADTVLIRSRYLEAKKKKFGGMMLTEFGAIINTTEGVKEINRITGLADQYFQSRSYTALMPLSISPTRDGFNEKSNVCSRLVLLAIQEVPRSHHRGQPSHSRIVLRRRG